MDVINLINTLKQKDGWNCGEPADEATVDSYQLALKVGFPPEYKTLLRAFGYIRWSGQYIAGICSNRTKYDVIFRTQTSKANKYHGAKFPAYGLSIQQYGGGGDYVLFGSQSEREGEVALFIIEEGYEEVQSWPSLTAYIQSRLHT